MLGYVQRTKVRIFCRRCYCASRSDQDVQLVERKKKAKMLLAAVKDCSRSKDVKRSKHLHLQAIESGVDSDIFLATAIVNMYAKCGSLEDAKRVFDRMPCRDPASWSTLLLGYVENGKNEQTLETFSAMRRSGSCEPNARAFMAALMACASLAAEEDSHRKIQWLETGREIYSVAARSGCDRDMFVASTAVDMFAKCGAMELARRVFDQMTQADVVPWTALLLGYAENGDPELGLMIFKEMQRKGCTPNARTYVAAVVACGNLAFKEQKGVLVDGKMIKMRSLETGMAIHCEAAGRGLDTQSFVANSLVGFYAKCGSLFDSRIAFDRNSAPDLVSWNSLILGYVENGEDDLALGMFQVMSVQQGLEPNARTFVAALAACGKSKRLETGRRIHLEAAKTGLDSGNVCVANSLIEMFAKCGELMEAQKVFDAVVGHPKTLCWNALIRGYVENGEHLAALEVFSKMLLQQYCDPNAPTFISALVACGALADAETGKVVQREVYRRGLEQDAIVANCILNFDCKCGRMVASQQFFDGLLFRDTIVWNSIIAGYSHQGDAEKVFGMFERMIQEGIAADGVTLISVLKACNHAGLIDRAGKIFKGMQRLGITQQLEHYTCLIDLLGRSNQVEEAMDLLRRMPFEADAVAWTAVLSACEKCKEAAIGKLAYESLLRIGEEEAAAFVLMGKIRKSCDEV